MRVFHVFLSDELTHKVHEALRGFLEQNGHVIVTSVSTANLLVVPQSELATYAALATPSQAVICVATLPRFLPATLFLGLFKGADSIQSPHAPPEKILSYAIR